MPINLEARLFLSPTGDVPVPDFVLGAVSAAVEDAERDELRSMSEAELREQCLEVLDQPPVRYQLNVLIRLACRVACGLETGDLCSSYPLEEIRYSGFRRAARRGAPVGRTSSARGGAVIGESIVGHDGQRVILPILHSGILQKGDPRLLSLPVGTVCDSTAEDEYGAIGQVAIGAERGDV